MNPKNMPPVGPGAETRVIHDVDSFSLAMSDGLQAEYVQLESKSFRGRWTTVWGAPIVAQFGWNEIGVARRVRVGEQRWAFMIPLMVPASARWNGSAVQQDEIIVCPPRSVCLAFDPPATQFAILTVETGSALSLLSDALCSSSLMAPLIVPGGTEAPKLRSALTQFRDAVESGHQPAAGDDLHRLLKQCLRSAIASRAGVPSLGNRGRTVRCVERFFRTHISEGVSVAQLSDVAGVSERSLRNAFHDVYTTSPKRYIKLWQLHQVRRTLRSAEVPGGTVTQAATSHGFSELGRFAVAYKSLFGEAPSETLNKARLRRVFEGAA